MSYNGKNSKHKGIHKGINFQDVVFFLGISCFYQMFFTMTLWFNYYSLLFLIFCIAYISYAFIYMKNRTCSLDVYVYISLFYFNVSLISSLLKWVFHL